MPSTQSASHVILCVLSFMNFLQCFHLLLALAHALIKLLLVGFGFGFGWVVGFGFGWFVAALTFLAGLLHGLLAFLSSRSLTLLSSLLFGYHSLGLSSRSIGSRGCAAVSLAQPWAGLGSGLCGIGGAALWTRGASLGPSSNLG